MIKDIKGMELVAAVRVVGAGRSLMDPQGGRRVDGQDSRGR